MNIQLKYESSNKQLSHIISNSINNLYCTIPNNNETTENIINLYADTSYKFTVQRPEGYYINFFYNFNYYKNTQSNVIYTYGITDVTVNNSETTGIGTISTEYTFKLNDINYNFTWSIFKISETRNSDNKFYYTQELSGKLKINNPLKLINLSLVNNRLLYDNNNYIHINSEQPIESNNELITLYDNINYIFLFRHNSKNISFNIYVNNTKNYNKLTIFSNNMYNLLYKTNLIELNNIKYKWSFTISNKEYSNKEYIGNLNFINSNKFKSNDEKLYDYKFKNIEINYRLFYNKFIYNEYLNIKRLNNVVNKLNINDSHKFLIINNSNNNIVSITLPSTNIYFGLTYNILLNQNLNLLTIHCEEDNNVLKGSFRIINKNNIYYKCLLSDSNDNNIIILSENVIIKKSNVTNHNGGLYKYGFIKIICSEYLDNKYVWNVEGNLIGETILYNNSYIYNSFT